MFAQEGEKYDSFFQELGQSDEVRPGQDILQSLITVANNTGYKEAYNYFTQEFNKPDTSKQLARLEALISKISLQSQLDDGPISALGIMSIYLGPENIICEYNT